MTLIECFKREKALIKVMKCESVVFFVKMDFGRKKCFYFYVWDKPKGWWAIFENRNYLCRE